MATVGQELASPESGWKRYDSNNNKIISNTEEINDPLSIGGTYYWLKDKNDYVKFRFKGTKLRIITVIQDKATSTIYFGGNINIKIDGVTDTFSTYGKLTYNIISYEKTNLENKIHEVEIVNPVGGYHGWIDAIDIDSNGYLTHPILHQVDSLDNMQIGDCIPCGYTATSGTAGNFSELGTCTANEIPTTGTATPDGLFYFIKVDKGTLIADRVVQHSISWDTLNAAKYIEGNKFIIDITNQPMLIDSGHIYDRSNIFDNKFNRSYGDGWESLTSASVNPYYGWWVGANIGVLTTIDSFSITAPSDCPVEAPYDFKFQASNDGIAWVDIKMYSSIIFKSSETKKFFIDKVSYSQYRILVTSSNYPLGSYNYLCIAQMEIGSHCTIRSISGGCTYADNDGNPSLTDKSLGAWPVNNEWDKYIVNSDLDGKITKGDDNIWHWKDVQAVTWCKETNVNNVTGVNGSANNKFRTQRGDHNNITSDINAFYGSPSGTNNQYVGFRPVLNYIESDIASEVIY